MLVLANGAPKGGSTWQFFIVQAAGFKAVPDDYQNRVYNNSSLLPERLDEFLDGPARAGDFAAKQHWHGSPRHRALLDHPHVKVLNIVRDIRDVLVSRYFHEVRHQRTAVDLPAYYWKSGRRLMSRYIDYHLFWHSAPPEPHLISFEGLRRDFAASVAPMLDFLGVPHPPERIAALRTTDALLGEGPLPVGEGNFMRKSVVGDWAGRLDPMILDDLDRLCRETGYYALLRAAAKRFPHLDLDYLPADVE